MRPTKTAAIMLLLFPTYLFAQKTSRNYSDTGWAKVQDNVFRLVLTAPVFPGYETQTILGGAYEGRICKKITAVAQLGFGYITDRFGPDEDPRRSSYHLFSALEARYYFSMDRRVKNRRPVINYTGPYISIQSSVITNKIISINQTPTKQFYGRVASYFDLGYQKQISKLYISGSCGVLLWGKRFSDYDDHAAGIHAALSVGYVW